MLNLFHQKLHPSWCIVFFCIGIVAGTIIGLVFRIGYFAAPIWIIFALSALIFTIFQPRTIFIILAIAAGITLALFRISSELFGEDYIKNFHDQTITITGTVDGDPETNDRYTKIKLKNLKFGEEKVSASGSIFISARQNLEISRADNLTINGKLSNGFGTYAGYMYKPTILEISRPTPGDFTLRVRNWFSARIQKLIPKPQANLGISYLLGMKSSLPDDLNENLRIVGLVHIIVASGAHLSILVAISRKIFGKFSRFSGLLFSILFILFFMSMIGFTPSILRAGIMSILTLLAWYIGYEFASWRIILLVAAGTLIINPIYIINLGWLLSFASFTGIMVLGPKFAKFFYGDQKTNLVAEIIFTTIAATLMTMPIILYFFGTISIISIVANLLILPTLPFAMGLVFLAGVFSNVPILETITAFTATKLLDFHIFIVELFASQKSFIININTENPQVFLIYLIIFIPLIVGLCRQKMLKSKYVRTQ